MFLHTTAQIAEMLRATGGVVVTHGGDSTWGHFENVPGVMGDPDTGVVASDPSVVIPAEALPEICLDSGGTATGVGEPIVVGAYVWTVRGIEPGTSQGEIRILLTNRRTSG